jgi:hypothetical protein
MIRFGRRRRQRARAALRASAAAPIQRPIPESVRSWWVRHESRWALWRIAYLAVLLGASALVVRDELAVMALVSWLVAGAGGWMVQSALTADLAGRRAQHRAAPGPAVGGWRIRGDIRELDPEALILADLIATIYESVRVVERPWRGHRGRRTAYARPLRNECRRWAASRALPVRTGDRYGRRLIDLGVLCRVQINQMAAWRVVHRRQEDAFRALEIALGVRLFDYSLGPDLDA